MNERLQEIEAQAAAMRVALENVKMRLSIEESSKGEIPRLQTHAEIAAALSPDAGREFEARIRAERTEEIKRDLAHSAPQSPQGAAIKEWVLRYVRGLK